MNENGSHLYYSMASLCSYVCPLHGCSEARVCVIYPFFQRTVFFLFLVWEKAMARVFLDTHMPLILFYVISLCILGFREEAGVWRFKERYEISFL